MVSRALSLQVTLFFFQTMNLWLHLIAAALWIGGVLFFLLVFGPVVRTLPPGAGIQVLERGRKSLQTLSWIAIGLLLITGALNLIPRSGAGGLLAGRSYYAILALKLFLFLAMLLHHSLQAFKYAPKIAALTAQTAYEIQSWPGPLLSYWKRWFVLAKINATLGLVVLLLAFALGRI